MILSVFLKCCLQGDGNTAAIRRREISEKGVKRSMMKSQRVSQEENDKVEKLQKN